MIRPRSGKQQYRSRARSLLAGGRADRRTHRTNFGELCRPDASGCLCRLRRLYEASPSPGPIVEALRLRGLTWRARPSLRRSSRRTTQEQNSRAGGGERGYKAERY
jgi:hypothetical protein